VAGTNRQDAGGGESLGGRAVWGDSDTGKEYSKDKATLIRTYEDKGGRRP